MINASPLFVFVSPCSGCVCSCCSPSVINKHVFPSGGSGLSGYFYLWWPSSAASFTHFFPPALLLARASLFTVLPVLASLLHLLHVMRSLCSAVPLLPLLSVLLVFYLNPSMLPHDEEALPPRAIFIKTTVCFLIYLPVCLKVFKCLTMKTNAEFTSATCL